MVSAGPFIRCGQCGRRLMVATILANVDQRGPDECWPWKRGRNRRGYGKHCHELAHRLVFRIKKGRLGKKSALHRCDNAPCCNDRHLFRGTQRDNIRDMDRKGRRVSVAPIGSESPNAKLNDEKVRSIRHLVRAMSQVDVAWLFGVDRSVVQGIIAGEGWRHVS